MLVDVREVSTPEDGKPVHWRLLTTHAVTSLADAQRIVDLYRMRWSIEEFFRLLKTAGFDIEETDIGDPQAMIKFVTATAIAAVTVMQLVKARDGTTDQQLTDAFEPDDQPILEALSTRLEGATTLQKNPHPNGSLAFAAWVIARLGGWTGYYGKPGPKVMRRELDDYRRIKYGTTLRLQDVTTPTPNPSPQGGGERSEHVAMFMVICGVSLTSYSPPASRRRSRCRSGGCRRGRARRRLPRW